MSTVENGKFVQVHYKGTLENGEVFDTSHGGNPLEVKMGEGHLIKGFEEALMGMEEKDRKNFTVTPEQAYGQRDDSLQRSFERAQLPKEMDPKVGDMVALHTAQGQQIPVKIKSVDDETVVVDLNHPLAGETLNFDIEVVGVTDEPTQPAGCGCGCDVPDPGQGDPCGGCGTSGQCG